MSSKHRPLLPMTSDQREHLELQSTQQPSSSQQCSAAGKRREVTAACKGCRERKTRCSRERPECGQCRAKNMECTYDTMPGESWSARLKMKKERTEHDLNTMMELYWYLRTQTPEDAAKALAVIRSGMDPDQVMQNLDTETQTDDMSAREAQNDFATTETNSMSRELSSTESPVAQIMLQPSKIIMALDNGVEAFFSCTGCIFHIYDHNEAQEMLGVVRQCLQHAGDNWPQIIFRGSAPNHIKASFCSVCIMAAIGLQYTKDPIPALGFEPSADNGTYQYVSIFYEITKHLVEAAVEDNVLDAIKVCAAMCVFNIISHATVALANADMGINFALNLGPSLRYCPAGLSEALWVNYKRVTRTLVTLRGWLVATLGYVAGDNPGLQAAVHWLIDQRDLTSSEIIQQELAKVVQIEVNLLRTINSFKNISAPVFGSIRRDLAQWHKQLPQWMHLKALVESSELPIGTRRTVFLVHLFYLSAHILVARLAHGEDVSVPSRYNDDEIRLAVGEGVLAARTASRVLQLQLDEQAVFQRCWLCEFTAYMSCLILLHSSTQLLRHRYPQNVWQRELSHAKSCIDVLEYCGEIDNVALRFADTTRGHYNALTAEAEGDIDLAVADVPEKFDHLFVVPESCPPHLDRTSQDLLELINRPFGYPSDLNTEGTLKAGFGSQLDWNSFATLPFNRAAPKVGDSATLLGIALSGMQSGQFLGSSRPHGWDAILNLNR